MLTGDQVLIGGFIVTGSEPKEVLLRAIGPSLSAFGITNPLPDPLLELHAGDGSIITTNDNWKDAANSSDIPANLQPTKDLESAILATLDPGMYTAIMSDKNGATGIGLVEGYDVDQAADSEFANISTRGFVDTGDNVMIGGFILGQGDSATVLIRALGPSLGALGVTGELPDPTLELHDSDGNIVEFNDNWQDAPTSTDIPPNLQPTDPLESAIFISLPAGTYTAIVAGKDGVTGVGLVEVYNLP